MKKKLWAVLLTIVTCFCLLFTFVACSVGTEDDSTGTSESSSDSTSSEDSSGDGDEETEITEIGDLLDSATNNTEASVEGVVFGVTDAGLYVNDGTGSIFVLYTDGEVSDGDSITASDGKFVLKNGQPIINYAEVTVNSSGNETLEATEGTIKEISKLDSSSRYSYSAYYTVTGTVSYDEAYRYVLTDGGYSIIIDTNSSDDVFADYINKNVTVDVITYSNSSEGWFVSYTGTEEGVTEIAIDIESIKDAVFAYVLSVLPTSVYGELDLPTSYASEPGLDFTWTVKSDTTAIVIVDNVAEISTSLETDEEVVLTLTISSLDVSASYDYTITVSSIRTIALDDIATETIASNENFYTEGTLISRARNNDGDIYTLILMGDTEYMRVDVSSQDEADSYDVGDTVKVYGSRSDYGVTAGSTSLVSSADEDFEVDYSSLSYDTLSTSSQYSALAKSTFSGTYLYKIEEPYMVLSGNPNAGTSSADFIDFGPISGSAKTGYSSCYYCFSLDALDYNGIETIRTEVVNDWKDGDSKFYGYTIYAFYVYSGSDMEFVIPGEDAIEIDEEEVVAGEILSQVTVTTFDAMTEGGTFTLPTSTASVDSITWSSDNEEAITVDNETGTATYTAQTDSEVDVTVKLTATYYVNEKLCTTEISIILTAVEPYTVSEAMALADAADGAGVTLNLEATVVGIASGHGGTLTKYSAQGLYLSDGTNILVLTEVGGTISLDYYYNYYIDSTAVAAGDVIRLYSVTVTGKEVACSSGTTGIIVSNEEDLGSWSYEADLVIDSEEDLAEYMANLTPGTGTSDTSYRDYSIVQVVATEDNPIYIGAVASYFLQFYYLDADEVDSIDKAVSGYATHETESGETYTGYIGSHTYSWLFATGDEWILKNTPVSVLDTSKSYGATATLTPSINAAGTYAFTGSFYFVLEYVGSTYPYMYCGILAAGFSLVAL